MKRILTLCLALMILLVACTGAPSKTADESLTWQGQYDLGLRYLSEGKYEEAIIAFTAAIDIDPRQPKAYAGRGDAHAGLLGQETLEDKRTQYYERAVEDYMRSLELDAQQVEVYLKVAEVHCAQDEFERAWQILEQGYDTTGNAVLLDRLHELGYFAASEPVVWTDPVLEGMIRGHLQRPDGEILVGELDEIKSMDIYGDTYILVNSSAEEDEQMWYRSVAGILDDETRGELTEFYGTGDASYTTRGNITNIDSLRYFRKLNGLLVVANRVTDISVMNSMHLSWANVWGNEISDLSPLDSLPARGEEQDQLDREQFVQIGDILPIY